MDNNFLFRGKRVDNYNKEWIYGHYVSVPRPMIVLEELTLTGGWDWFEVDLSTVGRCTGFTAAKSYRGDSEADRLIFEGDRCQDDKGTVVEIVWSDNHQWGCKIIKGCTLSEGLTFPLWQWDNCKMNDYRKLEIIGTIYDQVEGE